MLAQQYVHSALKAATRRFLGLVYARAASLASTRLHLEQTLPRRARLAQWVAIRLLQVQLYARNVHVAAFDQRQVHHYSVIAHFAYLANILTCLGPTRPLRV